MHGIKSLLYVFRMDLKTNIINNNGTVLDDTEDIIYKENDNSNLYYRSNYILEWARILRKKQLLKNRRSNTYEFECL